MSIVSDSVKVLGPDVAVILCAWKMAPGESVRTGFVTIVMQRRADGWHIVALQNTDTTGGT